jgi:hypothetical protein
METDEDGDGQAGDEPEEGEEGEDAYLIDGEPTGTQYLDLSS